MLMPGLVMLSSRAAGWVRSGRAARQRRRHRTLTQAPSLPPGVDAGELLEAARAQFMRLQAAWDAGDRATLAELTTPQMLEELSSELLGSACDPNRTEVLSLQACLLGFDDLGGAWLASIEFSGTVRETPQRGPVPFRELWFLTRECSESAAPWRLARHQALL